jgi:hypothetical protein
MILVAAAMVGVGSSVFHPESSRMARAASGGRHGLAQSLFQVGGNAGSAIGPLLAAFILETICLTCLHKDSHRRYSSAMALAEDLEAWLEHRPIAARPTTVRERLIKWIRRRPAVAALTCVSAVAVLVVLAGSLWHSQVLSHALDESDQLRRGIMLGTDRRRAGRVVLK